MGYKHLTREQRYTIEALLQTPMSLREIGEVIGVSAGTVSREKVHHLRPVQSGANLRPVPVEGGRDGMRGDNLPLDLAGEAQGQ